MIAVVNGFHERRYSFVSVVAYRIKVTAVCYENFGNAVRIMNSSQVRRSASILLFCIKEEGSSLCMATIWTTNCQMKWHGALRGIDRQTSIDEHLKHSKDTRQRQTLTFQKQ